MKIDTKIFDKSHQDITGAELVSVLNIIQSKVEPKLEIVENLFGTSNFNDVMIMIT